MGGPGKRNGGHCSYFVAHRMTRYLLK
jgi:hypothetical protein